MREITKNDTEDRSLVGINGQLRIKYEKDCYFHGVMILYDTTDGESFTEAVSAYKQLIASATDSAKLSDFAKIPVAFVGTKLDLTSFLTSDPSAVPKAVEVAELRPWLKKVHKKAESACFESSAFENIGVSMVVEWMAREAIRVYPAVEATKPSKALRFDMSNQKVQMQGSMKVLLAKAGLIDADEDDEEVMAAVEKYREQKWNRHLREDAKSAVGMKDICSIF